MWCRISYAEKKKSEISFHSGVIVSLIFFLGYSLRKSSEVLSCLVSRLDFSLTGYVVYRNSSQKPKISLNAKGNSPLQKSVGL